MWDGSENPGQRLEQISADSCIGRVELACRVGTSLGQLRQELVDIGAGLARVLGPGGSGMLDKAVQTLAQQSCRIAVIGQIKSGKSSFINAFVRRPELLPTSVNPWTTAVTNLHFGDQHACTDDAVFHFFSATEWEQLANGGGKLRELTERLVPGFKPDLLRWYVSALRTRAAARLGPEFTALLGQQHRVPELTSDILHQFVCQGDPSSAALASDPVGRYSDVTKSADIHLPPGPFDYPVTVIDTPGTNDPFLIRDEITRRCLESADLYVVVLTARQALSAADVALLRILRSLHKDQIIVFVNRIDELADIAGETEGVTAAVRRQLQTEFPGADIPLIAGSAWWANNAMTEEAGALDRCLGREAIGYLQHKGVWPPEHIVHALRSDDEALACMRDVLFAGSGLRDVYQAVDRLLGTSRFASMMHQMTSCFLELTHASEAAAREELQSYLQTRVADVDAVERAAGELSWLRSELERLQKVSSIIDRSATLFEERQMEIVTAALVGLRSRLLAKVDHYASVERAALVNRLLKGKAPRAWSFDSQRIRRELTDEFVDGFHQAAAQLLDLQQEIIPHLRGLLSMLVPDSGSRLTLDAVHRPVPPPRMMSLGSYVSLDLDSSWWSQWWKRQPTALRRGREVEQLIRQEFRTMVDELLGACRQNLGEHVKATTEWSFGICEIMASSISQRREQLLQHYETLEQQIGGRAGSYTEAERLESVATLQARLEECETLRHKLELIGSDTTRSLALTTS